MDKRLVKSCSVVVGHYGGGKTNFAVNLALALKAEKPQTPVRIADLDTVNPYFRTADASELLLSRGVIPLLPEFAGSNVDIPMIPSALRSAVRDPAGFTVVDVGGDDGAVALGMFRSDIHGGGRAGLHGGDRGTLGTAVHGSRQQLQPRGGDGGAGPARLPGICPGMRGALFPSHPLPLLHARPRPGSAGEVRLRRRGSLPALPDGAGDEAIILKAHKEETL